MQCGDGTRRCTEYHTWDFESISSLIQGTLCRHIFGMTSIKVFKVCYLTANVFFALCKYSTGKGLVTNVNKEKKWFNEVLFSACFSSLHGYLRWSP